MAEGPKLTAKAADAESDLVFRLKKSTKHFKPGTLFKCYGGLLRGVGDINFDDKEWFEVYPNAYAKQFFGKVPQHAG